MTKLQVSSLETTEQARSTSYIQEVLAEARRRWQIRFIGLEWSAPS